MTTSKIFHRYNNNLLKRIVMDIKNNEPLCFNPKFDPNHSDYNKPISK